MELQEFDFYLPKELIAQKPLEHRDQSRLMVLHRKSGKIEHSFFPSSNFAKISDVIGSNIQSMIFSRSKVSSIKIIGKLERNNFLKKSIE